MSKREVKKEMREHPWASRSVAEQIARNHARKPKEGKYCTRHKYKCPYGKPKPPRPDQEVKAIAKRV